MNVPKGHGRVALVTGGARGIGRVVCQVLARDGFDIIVNFRQSKEAALSLVEEVRAVGGKAVALPADVGKLEDVEAMARAIQLDFGRLDVLVNNAGPYIFERKTIEEIDKDQWDEMVAGNLTAVYHTVHTLVPLMKLNRWGRIINFGFNRSVEAPAWPERSAYAAAKVGLVSLTKTLAVELARYNITANMVCPGKILDANKERFIEEVRHTHDGFSQLGRAGCGEDLARVVAFLCQEDSAFVTGNVISVAGGYDVIQPFSRELE